MVLPDGSGLRHGCKKEKEKGGSILILYLYRAALKLPTAVESRVASCLSLAAQLHANVPTRASK